MALARKWQTACDRVGPAIDAFEDLTRNTSPEHVQAWTEAAESAARERHNKYEVMDIYDVQSVKCESSPCPDPNEFSTRTLYMPEHTIVPTQQQIQLELAKAENTRQGAQQGVAAWIVSGLKLEESKYVALPMPKYSMR